MVSTMRCALLHGFAGTPAVWTDVIAAWQHASFPVAFALPGHNGGPVLATWDDNLDALVDVRDADFIVGYSLGARIALGLIATGRCAHAVLVGVNPGLDDAERASRRASDAAWARLLRERGIAAFAEAWAAQPLFASQARVSPERLAARRTCRAALDPEELARSLEVMGVAEMPDYRGAIVADRVALVAGADDLKYLAIARRFSVACETIRDSGHDPTLEQPAALAAAIVRLAART